AAAPRTDMVALAQFLPNVFCSLPSAPPDCVATWTNQIAPADLLRLNLAIAPVMGTPANRMGALQGDFGGFPNGRRLTDDIVDAAEQVVIGGALVAGRPPGMIPPLGDGVDQTDKPFTASFPSLALPHEGYIRSHTRYEPIH